MANWTLGTYVDRIRDQADAVGHPRWDDNKFVIPKLATVHALMWRSILNANKRYRTATRTVTTNGSGAVPWADLDGGAADHTKERTYRVLGVSANGVPLRKARQRDIPIDPSLELNASGLQWYPDNRLLKTLPLSPGLPLVVVVNHLPARADALGGSQPTTKELIFVEDFEQALVFTTAAFLFTKGGAQTRESIDMLNMARPFVADLLADVRREAAEPLEYEYADEASEWGAQDW